MLEALLEPIPSSGESSEAAGSGDEKLGEDDRLTIEKCTNTGFRHN